MSRCDHRTFLRSTRSRPRRLKPDLRLSGLFVCGLHLSTSLFCRDEGGATLAVSLASRSLRLVFLTPSSHFFGPRGREFLGPTRAIVELVPLPKGVGLGSPCRDGRVPSGL